MSFFRNTILVDSNETLLLRLLEFPFIGLGTKHHGYSDGIYFLAYLTANGTRTRHPAKALPTANNLTIEPPWLFSILPLLLSYIQKICFRVFS